MDVLRFPRLFRHLINLWPPYMGTGISVRRISDDWREITVAMRLRWYNRNYVGTHFGGSLFSMTDPFYMLLLLKNLGGGYRVWDTAATITFLKPGRGTVTAVFRLEDHVMNTILEKTAGSEKYLAVFTVDVVDQDKETVARVEKTVYIRRKKAK